MVISIDRTLFTQAFEQSRSPDLFLSSFFTTKPGQIYRGTKVQIDIRRFGEDVATVVARGTGPNMNDYTEWTTKEFTPPSYDEATPFESEELNNRQFGLDPYTAEGQGYQAQLASQITVAATQNYQKIQRAAEFQAKQILQTGQLSLADKNGNTRYELDFKPKATHFPTAGVSWAGGSGTPLADLESLIEVIRDDGQVDTDRLILGSGAYSNLLSYDSVQKQLDNRRIEVGRISPEMRGRGAVFKGILWIGDYEVELWTYTGRYKDPATGTITRFVEDDKVIALSSQTRLDRTFAMCPRIAPPDPRVAGLLPGRISSVDGSFDVTPNIWVTPDGKQLTISVESRPLLIPAQIDGFGCLDTEP